jgi:hypothetical protein
MKSLAFVFLIGCGVPGDPSGSATVPQATQRLADLRYAGPVDGWNHTDTQEINRSVSRWVPKTNANKESISIIRTERRPALKNATIEDLRLDLEQAQTSLPTPAVRAARAATTKQHLQEVEIVADFVPAGLTHSPDA